MPASFWDRVDNSDPDGCWLWTGSRTTGGYGNLRWNGRHVYAHRLSYELAVGPIGEGLEIDHLCRVRNCVNPAHLEPVTHRENGLRGVSPAAIAAKRSACGRGHRYEEGSFQVRRGKRECIICRRAEPSRASRRAS